MKKVLFLLVSLCFAGVRLDAQPAPATERGAFLTLLGNDTLAVERFRRAANGMEADVVLRTPQTTLYQYRIDLDSTGRLRRYEVLQHAPQATAGAPPVRHDVVVPEGNRLKWSVLENGQTRVQTVEGDGRSLPFIDMVHWPFELMLQRVGHEADTTELPLFTERGIVLFKAVRTGPDRVDLIHPFRGTMNATVDASGRPQLLDAAATTRKLTVRRFPDLDVEGLARIFASRDVSGRSFGPLSGRGAVAATVRGASIKVDYGTPAVRGRAIFGHLVPYGQVWRTGANQATHFETDRPLLLGGTLAVPAGRYTLFSIPEEAGGLLIVNRQTGQGGTAYDATQDLGRVRMARTSLAEPVELFTIRVDESPGGGILRLQWDKAEYSVPFSVR